MVRIKDASLGVPTRKPMYVPAQIELLLEDSELVDSKKWMTFEDVAIPDVMVNTDSLNYWRLRTNNEWWTYLNEHAVNVKYILAKLMVQYLMETGDAE